MSTLNWYEKVTAAEKDFQTLWSRHASDESIYLLDAYEMTNSLGEAIPEVYNIKMPDAKIYADTIVADLKIADLITEITGKEIEDTHASEIELMLNDIFRVNDDDLSNLGVIGGLHAAHSGQTAVRGSIYTKCFPYMWHDIFHPGIIPWDSRYSSYGTGADGLEYMTTNVLKSKDKINAQYPGIGFYGDEGYVRDILTPEECIIYVAGREAKRFPHKFGFVPGVVEFNPINAFLRSEGYMQNEGESCFSSVRDLYAALDRVASALITVTMRSFRYNIFITSDSPEGADTEFDASPFGEANLFGMKRGERFEVLSVADLKRTVTYLLNLIETRLQRGSLPSSDYGNVSAPMSAIAIKHLGEARNKILGPCMQTIARTRERLNRMILKQWKIMGDEFFHDEITEPSKGLLNKKIDIKCDMVYVSPMENIANYTIAAEALQYLPMEDVLADILHIKDPQDTIRRKRAERANMVMPELELIDIARAAWKEGDKYKAQYIAMKLEMSLQQVLSGGMKPQGQLAQNDFNVREQARSNVMGLLQGGNKVAPGAQSSQEEAAQLAQQQEVTSGRTPQG